MFKDLGHTAMQSMFSMGKMRSIDPEKFAVIHKIIMKLNDLWNKIQAVKIPYYIKYIKGFSLKP